MNATQQVLESLRRHVEYKSPNEVWGSVYLDNARIAGINEKQFRAILASLSKQGLYKVVDGYAWGDVKIAD